MAGCAYCGANGSTKLVRDHVVPRARGGPDNAFNLVMACEPCNSAKRDSTAIEWLGDRCPGDVREIEDRVNAKLRRDFQKRDVKKPFRFEKKPELFAFHYQQKEPIGGIDYIGTVLNETDTTLRLEVLDAFMATGCGMWVESGEIRDLPKDECRLFNDKMVCLETALRTNQMIYDEYPSTPKGR